uniref:Peptidase aspartic putative domain-containing protein n=1 Tax=Panagrolaimus superbus TaxID=310955 RepID=A0A914YS41_9BILA
MKRATPDPSSIRYAVDSIHNICRQLENQGCCIDNEPMKLDIMDRMPDEMQKKLYWFNQSTNATTNEVLKKMEKLALKAETVPPSIASSQPTLSKSIEVNNVTKIESTTWKATSQSCRLCDGQHRPSRCPTYSTPQAKIRQLNNKKWCVKCMSKDHIANNCPRTNIKCSKCNGSHLFFLCTKSIAEDNSKAMMSINRSQSAMLAKKVLVSHPSNGHEAEVTVFFDSGSQRSYVSKNLMKKLDLPIVNTETITVTGFGGKVSCCKSDLALMKLKTDDGWQELYANSVEKIVDRIPVIEKKKMILSLEVVLILIF